MTLSPGQAEMIGGYSRHPRGLRPDPGTPRSGVPTGLPLLVGMAYPPKMILFNNTRSTRSLSSQNPPGHG